MKLRYYMRGLGIGIFVTAILMSVTINGKTEKLTDAEIIERAEQLGMEQKYESTVLADTVSENETEETDTDGSVIDNAEETESQVSEAEPQESKPEEIEPQEIKTDVTEDVPVSDAEIGETVQITVYGGDGSQTVARKLLEAGLIEDAQAYDRFLCSNGYDKRICTGTHAIPVGASDEEIAKIITSRP